MFLLTGDLGGAGDRPNPAPEWLNDRGWKELLRLEKLPAFSALCSSIESSPAAWRPLYDSLEPHKVALPGRFNALKPFHKARGWGGWGVWISIAPAAIAADDFALCTRTSLDARHPHIVGREASAPAPVAGSDCCHPDPDTRC